MQLARPSDFDSHLENRLIELVRQAPLLMSALSSVRKLGLSSWCIGAGAVRGLVWDSLHGFETPSVLEDIDVVYYDPAVHSASRDAELQRQLTAMMPGVCWEVTNQATVHHWFQASLGETVAPLRSLEEGVSTWPEFATCVGVCLHDDGSLHVVAPYGLQDLFALRVRHNPARASASTFMERVEQKRFSHRWPRLEICPA